MIAEAIVKTRSLIKLDVSANELEERGGEIIFKALERNESIVSLTIGSPDWMLKNKLGPIGVFGLRSLLQSNSILTFLNVSGNHI